jgi:hypothetical protein
MPDLFPTSTWQIFFTIIISGGIVAGLFEWLRNYMAKRREEYIDISNLKIKYISKSLPYYGNIIFNTTMLSGFLRTGMYATYRKLILYYLCNMLYIKSKYFREFGAIQLSSSYAETAIESISTEINFTIANKLGYRDLSLLSHLVNDNSKFHEFEDILQSKKPIEDNFLKIFSDSDLIQRLEKICRIFSEILTFEINIVYQEWYGKKEVLSFTLSDDAMDYIKDKLPNTYYERVTSIVNWTLKRRIAHPLLWKQIKVMKENHVSRS